MSKQTMMTLSALAALCVLATLSMRARAQEQQDPGRREGMVVVRDQQTGKMRAPTPEELMTLRSKAPATAAALGGSPREPQLTTRRDGARGVRLGEKHLVFEVLTRGADGKLSSQCVQGEAAASQALAPDKGAPHERASAHQHGADHETR